ncbi:hypothetical protein LZ32DRAFT_603464 [Colletotrichum eremochloae]|nr:hypothetical protein LZ32DRAFT_603464 [Colletotrichum eremochloae]
MDTAVIISQDGQGQCRPWLKNTPMLAPSPLQGGDGSREDYPLDGDEYVSARQPHEPDLKTEDQMTSGPSPPLPMGNQVPQVRSLVLWMPCWG